MEVSLEEDTSQDEVRTERRKKRVETTGRDVSARACECPSAKDVGFPEQWDGV